MPSQFQSPEIQAWAAGFPVLLGHALLALAIWAAACALYAVASPHRELSRARAGNGAAAISLAGALAALALCLAGVVAASASAADMALWGVTTAFVELVFLRLLDLALSFLVTRIAAGKIAAAVLLAAARLSLGGILAAALSP